MATDDSTKAAVLKLLRRGLVTPTEAARLAGRSRQIVAHWAKELPVTTARAEYLERLWRKATGR